MLNNIISVGQQYIETLKLCAKIELLMLHIDTWQHLTVGQIKLSMFQI